MAPSNRNRNRTNSSGRNRNNSSGEIRLTVHHGESSLSEPTPRPRTTSSVTQRRGSSEVPQMHVTNVLTQPAWFKQVTVRAIIISFLLSLLYVTLAMKFTLSTGIVPPLSTSVGLVGFFTVKLWMTVVGKGHPFTPQENAIIQACVGAAVSVVFSGGFGNYLFAMSSRTANQSSEVTTTEDVMILSLGRMITFLISVSLAGFGIVVMFWKTMIVDFKLLYPSGTASGHLINNLHALGHNILAKEEVHVLLISSAFGFVWSGLRWIFTRGIGCGLVLPIPFPKAYENGFYLELSAAYAGVGMLCSYMINISQLVGGILSSAILWPFFDSKKGDWYSIELEPTSMCGLQGYKVFLAIATIMGEGVYNCVCILLSTHYALYKDFFTRTRISGPSTRDDSRKDEVFIRGEIGFRSGFYCYVTGVVIAFLVVSWIFFDQLTWLCILGIYVVAPFLAFFNAYGCGLTDVSLASVYGKMTIFAVGAWARAEGGVITGLAACGLVMSVVSTASDLLHDFKTGYMTLTPPRSILASQIIGIIMGCIISPCILWFFSQMFDDLGIIGSAYSVPYALVYRSISALAVDNTLALPKYCIIFCLVFFSASIVISVVRDLVDKKWVKFIPGPMAMAIGVLTCVAGAAPDSIGSNFTLDMCLGGLFIFIWRKKNKDDAEAGGLAVASGLICGEGIWILFSLCLTLGGVKAPFCMKLLSDEEMTKLKIKPL